MSTATSGRSTAATSNPSTLLNTAMNLRVYSTLSRQKEPFQTVQPGHVGMYLCGPTVYKEAHIGHMVGPVIFDCIKRYLTYCGYQVNWVVNITDVDDKLIAEANRRNIPMSQVAEEMTADYLHNLRAMGVDQIDHLPRATEHMDGICNFISTLIDNGFAYAADGDVFFEVSKDPGYGKLSNRTAEDQLGEGGEAAGRKRSAGDFALWKRAKPGEPAWESPWGKGRPGWHIECSAMSRALLGETFDIHGGGLDLMFPHHENEIAQSECCHGKPMARYWMHNGLMRASTASGKVGGRADREGGAAEGATVEEATSGKISRSKGAGGLATLIAKQGGERIRFFLLRTHYRSTIVFGDEGLAEAGTALATFHRFFERFTRVTGESFYALPTAATRIAGAFAPGENALLKQVAAHRDGFLDKMDDDFNTGGAVSELFELVRLLNRYIDQEQLETPAASLPASISALRQGALTLKELAAILGLFQVEPPRQTGEDEQSITGLMPFVLELRQQARVNKDFPLADQIRDSLTAAGLALEDRKAGDTTWRIDGDAAVVMQAIMSLLIDVRAQSRAKKDFATADRVREVLTANGIVLEDRKGETGWRRTS